MAIGINGSGTITGISAGGLPDGTVDADTLATNAVANAKVADDAIGLAELSATGTASSSTFLRGDNSWAAAGGGKLLQVVQTEVTDTKSVTSAPSSTQGVDLGISVAITPGSASSKILVLCDLNYAQSASFGAFLWLKRGSTVTIEGADASNRIGCTKYLTGYSGTTSQDALHIYQVSINHLDSPSYTVGDTLTYKIQVGNYSTNYYSYLNRTHTDQNLATYDGRGSSTMIAMEIGA